MCFCIDFEYTDGEANECKGEMIPTGDIEPHCFCDECGAECSQCA